MKPVSLIEGNLIGLMQTEIKCEVPFGASGYSPVAVQNDNTPLSVPAAVFYSGTLRIFIFTILTLTRSCGYLHLTLLWTCTGWNKRYHVCCLLNVLIDVFTCISYGSNFGSKAADVAVSIGDFPCRSVGWQRFFCFFFRSKFNL